MRGHLGRFAKIVAAGLLLSTTAFGSSSDSSHEESVASQQRSVEREQGQLSRKTVRVKKLNKLLDCATALVENQYGGSQSSLRGLEFMSQAVDRVRAQNYNYGDLTTNCKIAYHEFKKAERKDRVNRERMVGQTQENYMAQVREKYSEKPGIVALAEKSLNPNLECRKAMGFDVKAGAILSVGLGWDHYVCRSPLGRKYHVFGPATSVGLGVGATVDAGLCDQNTFSYPLHTHPFDVTTDDAESTAVIFGRGETQTSDRDVKSKDLSIGVGMNNMERMLTLFRAKGRANYFKSDVYKNLELPAEVYWGTRRAR